MPSTEERLKDVLDETRLAMLGTQLLMGLQYRAAFTPGWLARKLTRVGRVRRADVPWWCQFAGLGRSMTA